MEIIRCRWCLSHRLLTEYHDEEWGVPIKNDIHLFKHFVLEIFQAGLNWLIMLKKLNNFHAVFAGFNAGEVAEFSEERITCLMEDAGIIRNRAKIEAVVNNARCFLSISEEYDGFHNFLEEFRPKKCIVYRAEEEIPAYTPESERLAKELKKRGFKFIGPISAYAYMQGVGLVNDHVESCFRFGEIVR